MTSSINIRDCDTSKPKCLELRNYSDEAFAMEIASESCITDKNSLIERFTALRKSLENNFTFYNGVYPNIKNDIVENDYNTPGKEIEILNEALLDIKPKVDIINLKLGNTFKILQSFEGNLEVLTNCFILKRQLAIIQPGFCFVLMPTLVSATLYIFLVNLMLIGTTWGIFMAIKYAGDLGEKGIFNFFLKILYIIKHYISMIYQKFIFFNKRMGWKNKFWSFRWTKIHDVETDCDEGRRNRGG